MRYYLDHNAGEIRLCGGLPVPPHITEGCERIFTDELPVLGRHYVKDGALTLMPDKPGEGYIFNYTAGAWLPSLTLQWQLVRYERDALLQRSEWRRWRALDQGVAVPAEWLLYWQALRDITKQADPFNIVWPEPPSA